MADLVAFLTNKGFTYKTLGLLSKAGLQRLAAMQGYEG